VFGLDFLQSLLGLRGPLYFGGGSPPGPTAQQQALQTSQALQTANLNLEENEQRKVILNAMQGTRVFRGSALSRAVAKNTPGEGPPLAPPGPSAAQLAAPIRAGGAGSSLLDLAGTPGGASPAGGGSSPGGRGGGSVGRGPSR
jgi:hypothetical protein